MRRLPTTFWQRTCTACGEPFLVEQPPTPTFTAHITTCERCFEMPKPDHVGVDLSGTYSEVRMRTIVTFTPDDERLPSQKGERNAENSSD